MIDARLLFDVHFQQGKRGKDTFPAPAHAEEAKLHVPPAPPGEGWHTEEEQIGSVEHPRKEAEKP